jgi:hypothetical protein
MALKHYKLKSFVENSATGTKKMVKCPFFNNFHVPQNAWDKVGTNLGQDLRNAINLMSPLELDHFSDFAVPLP